MSLDIPAGQFVTVIGSERHRQVHLFERHFGRPDGGQRPHRHRWRGRHPYARVGPCRARGPRVPGPDGGHLRRPHHRRNMALAQRRGTFRNLGRAVKGIDARGLSRAPGHAGPGAGKPPDRPHRSALGRPAPGREPADGSAAALAHPAAGRAHRRARPTHRRLRAAPDRTHRGRAEARPP